MTELTELAHFGLADARRVHLTQRTAARRRPPSGRRETRNRRIAAGRAILENIYSHVGVSRAFESCACVRVREIPDLSRDRCCASLQLVFICVVDIAGGRREGTRMNGGGGSGRSKERETRTQITHTHTYAPRARIRKSVGATWESRGDFTRSDRETRCTYRPRIWLGRPSHGACGTCSPSQSGPSATSYTHSHAIAPDGGASATHYCAAVWQPYLPALDCGAPRHDLRTPSSLGSARLASAFGSWPCHRAPWRHVAARLRTRRPRDRTVARAFHVSDNTETSLIRFFFSLSGPIREKYSFISISLFRYIFFFD